MFLFLTNLWYDYDMEQETQFATFVNTTKNYHTLHKALKKGLNIGVFGFTTNQTEIFFSWRLRGDIIEVKNLTVESEWLILHENNLEIEFDKGVFGKQVDWSIPKRFVSSLISNL